MICAIHSTELVMKPAGVSKKTGKSYQAFLACNQKNADGSYCSYKPPRATGTAQAFEQDLDKSSAQMDLNKRDNTISKLAIAKEFISRGDKWSLETQKEMEHFLDWAEGKKPKLGSSAYPPTVPKENPDNEIRVEDIPF